MTFLFLEFILSKERRYFQIYIYIHAFRYNFSWEIKYSLYSQEFRNSEKRTGYSLWKFWFCFLKKFAIHKKTTGYYCLWKFWFSLLSRNSQFTKNQQGTPFEKKEDFDSFLAEVESTISLMRDLKDYLNYSGKNFNRKVTFVVWHWPVKVNKSKHMKLSFARLIQNCVKKCDCW